MNNQLRNPLQYHGRTPQLGLGLVELMVAMVLGLLIISGVLGIYISNQRVFKSNEDLSRLQENARVSFELMARELRESGGSLCGAKVVSNVLNNAATEWSSNWDAGSIKGYEGDEDAPAVTTEADPPPATPVSGQRIRGTDAIQILSGATGQSATITAHDPAAAQLTLSPATHGFKAGDLVVICDGSSAAIAQLSSVTGADVFHAKVVSDTPGNCSQGLGSPTNCSTTTGNAKTMQAGGFVSPFSAGTWYIANNSRGGKSLFRKGAGSAEEIAEGVVNMQLEYLLRTEATDTLDADWSEADDITDWTSSAAKQVIAIRAKLTLETLNKISTNNETISRDLVYVVNLRNRLN